MTNKEKVESKIGVIEYVAKTGSKGIKFEGESDWYNPRDDAAKDCVQSDLQGKEVEIFIDPENSKQFISLICLGAKNPEFKGHEAKKPKVVNISNRTNKEEPVTEKTDKDEIPKNFIITLNGKEFITHQGLLYMAHKKGVQQITTNMVSECGAELVVFKATVIMITNDKLNKVFTGYGDADKDNVNSQIVKHKLRMAETRAVSRALRLAVNCGMTSVEELGGDQK